MEVAEQPARGRDSLLGQLAPAGDERANDGQGVRGLGGGLLDRLFVRGRRRRRIVERRRLARVDEEPAGRAEPERADEAAGEERGRVGRGPERVQGAGGEERRAQ